MGKDRDVVESLSEIYGDNVKRYATEDKALVGLSGEAFVESFQRDPTCQSSYWAREANLRIFVEELVDREKLTNPKILSAACGSGAEPLELALRLADKGVSFKIDAFDVSISVISRAKEGIIHEISGIDLGPLERMEKKKLVKCTDGKPIEQHNRFLDYPSVLVDSSVRSKVEFSVHDIIDSPFHQNEYDVVFCNNLLMHYPAHTRELIVIHLLKSLKDGGMLALEYEEMLGGMGGTAERTRWLAPYNKWKSDLGRFGLTLVPDVFFSQRIYRYSKPTNSFDDGEWVIRDGQLVKVPNRNDSGIV